MDSLTAHMTRRSPMSVAGTAAQAPDLAGANACCRHLVCSRRKALGLLLGLPSLSPMLTQAQQQEPQDAPEASQISRTPGPRPGTWPELNQLGQGARLWGNHRFRHWGFHVYDAQLWVRKGFDSTRAMAHPLALSLVYARDIKAQDLIDRSLQEIERQASFSAAQSRQWSELMSQAFVDVRAGDRLTGIYSPTDRATLFHNGRATAEWRDAQFVPLFFGIWLSAQTSQPRMRNALLKLSDAPGADRDA
jgi:Chalcone isomerase-like